MSRMVPSYDRRWSSGWSCSWTHGSPLGVPGPGKIPARSCHIAAAILSAIEGAYRVSAGAPGVLPEGYASPTLRRMIDGLLAAEALG